MFDSQLDSKLGQFPGWELDTALKKFKKNREVAGLDEVSPKV